MNPTKFTTVSCTYQIPARFLELHILGLVMLIPLTAIGWYEILHADCWKPWRLTGANLNYILHRYLFTLVNMQSNQDFALAIKFRFIF